MKNPCKICTFFLLFFLNSLNATEFFSNVFCGKMLDVESGLVRNNAMIGIVQDSGGRRFAGPHPATRAHRYAHPYIGRPL